MIIFGTGSKNLGVKKLKGAKCSNCDSNDMYAQGYMKYFDIFWIPIFPYSKKTFSVCGNCKQALNKNEMSQQLRDKINLQKSDFSVPWYLFSGLFLIVIGISFSAYSSNQHEKEVNKNISHLSPNDILVLKEAYNEYVFAKVINVQNDTVYFNGGNYVYEGGVPTESDFKNKKSGIDDFFVSETSYFLQRDIDSLYSIKYIVDIFKGDK